MRSSYVVLALVAGAVGAGSAPAGDLQSKFDLLDRRAATISANAQEGLVPSVKAATGWPSVHYRGAYNGPYLKLARQMAETHRVPQDLFARLVERESRWNPHAVSSKGAIGLGQLMPETAAALGVDPRDPKQNLDGAARYLRRQFDDFRDWRLALAAYNAGPEAVRRYGGVPPYAETQAYVVAILGQ